MHKKSLYSVALIAAVSIPGVLAAQEPTIPSQPPVPSEPTQPPMPQEPVVSDSAPGDVELTESAPSFVSALAANAELSTFAELAEAAGLAEVLSSAGAVTIFAPSNEAFAKIPAEQLDALKADSALLRALLLSHVVPGKVSSADAATLGNAKSVIGSDVAITSAEGKLSVGNASVTKADVEAGESVIHVIDTVLLPAESAPSEAPAAPTTPPTEPMPAEPTPAEPTPAEPTPSIPPAEPAPSTPPVR